MLTDIDTKNPRAVESEVQAIYRAMFPTSGSGFVPNVFGQTADAFSGKRPGYQAIDAFYHDLEHTLQGALCLARLLKRRFDLHAKPVLSQRMFELGILAILMHDTGYLKQTGDNEGTGAKYALVHVERSLQFADDFMTQAGYSKEEIHSVQRMIRCTGINVKLDEIKFTNESERLIGFALGTADLLGQMAARDYVDKLPILYSEFAEAARVSGGSLKAGGFFTSLQDLLQKTPLFWEKYVRNKLENDFMGLYRFFNDPFPNGDNCYVQRVEANITRIREELKKAKV